MPGPDPRKRARLEIVGAIVGGEAGAALGLLVFGSVPLAPLGLAVGGAALGAGALHLRHKLFRRWLRGHLRAAR